MQVPPAYSQFVDSNEYYIDQIIQDGMENITMVVDRNRSYLVGSKDGIVYRISGYGPGDTRLQENQVVYRYCETKNKKLVVSETFTKYGNDSALEIYNQYTSTQKPSDLLPRKINRRNQQRQELDKFRNRAHGTVEVMIENEHAFTQPYRQQDENDTNIVKEIAKHKAKQKFKRGKKAAAKMAKMAIKAIKTAATAFLNSLEHYLAQ